MSGSEKFIKKIDSDNNGDISTKELEKFFDEKNRNFKKNVKIFSETYTNKENISELKKALNMPLTQELNDVINKLKNGNDIQTLASFEIRMVQLYRMVVLGDESAQITGEIQGGVMNKDYIFLMQYLNKDTTEPELPTDIYPQTNNDKFTNDLLQPKTPEQRADEILNKPRIDADTAQRMYVKDSIKSGNLDWVDYMRKGFMKKGNDENILNEELENHIIENNNNTDVSKVKEVLSNPQTEKALAELVEGNENGIREIITNFGIQNQSDINLDGTIIENNKVEEIINKLKDIIKHIKEEAEKELKDGQVKQQIKNEFLAKAFPSKTEFTEEENKNIDENMDIIIEQLIQDKIITDMKGCIRTNLLKYTIQNNESLKTDKVVDKYAEIQGIGGISDESMHSIGEISKEIATEGAMILITMGVGTIVARLSVSALRMGINTYRTARGLEVLNNTIRLGNLGKNMVVGSEVLASGVGLNIGTSIGEGVFRKIMGENFDTEEVMHNITSFEHNMMSIAFAGGMRGFAVGEHMALGALKAKMNPAETIMKVVKHGMKGAEAGAINFIENDIIPFTFEGGETKEWTVGKYMKALGLVYAYSYVNKKGGKINEKLEQIEQKGGKIIGTKIKELIVKEDGSFNIVLLLPNNKSVILNQNGQEIDREGNIIPKENVVLYGANNQPLKQEAKEAGVLFDQYGRVIPATENKKPEHKNHEDPAKHPLEPEVRVNLFKLALEDQQIYKEFEQRFIQNIGKGKNIKESVAHSIDEHLLKERLEDIVNAKNHSHKKIEITEHQIKEVKEKFGELSEVISEVKSLEKDIRDFLKKEKLSVIKKNGKLKKEKLLKKLKKLIIKLGNK